MVDTCDEKIAAWYVRLFVQNIKEQVESVLLVGGAKSSNELLKGLRLLNCSCL